MPRRGAGDGGLTERDRFWRGHLERQAAGAETSRAYAAREQLSIYALYQARKRLIALGAWPAAAKPRRRRRRPVARAARFTRLALPAAAPSTGPACRVRLASGAVVEWSAPPPVEWLVRLVAPITASR